MLKPGTYKLAADLVNPCPDRRVKRDWRSFPVWGKDCEFLVTEERRDHMLDTLFLAGLPEDTRKKLIDASRYSVIQLVGNRWSHEKIGPGNDEQYAALEAALVPVEESVEAMFTRLGVNDYFAKYMVRSGRMTPREFEELWYKYLHED